MVTDVSMLHLMQLVQTEVRSPQCMSQTFVAAIALVLATHLLQHWQMERRQSNRIKHNPGTVSASFPPLYETGQ
jgi:hypothetical protein